MRSNKAEPKKIGKVGSHDVVDFGKGFPCLQLDEKTALGVTKIKAVLANVEVCRRFLVEYDRPKDQPAEPKPAPVAQSADLAKELAELRAQLAALTPAASKAEIRSGRFAAK